MYKKGEIKWHIIIEIWDKPYTRRKVFWAGDTGIKEGDRYWELGWVNKGEVKDHLQLGLCYQQNIHRIWWYGGYQIAVAAWDLDESRAGRRGQGPGLTGPKEESGLIG